MDNKIKVSVTLPPDLVKVISDRATLEHRSFSGQLSYFLAVAVGQMQTSNDNNEVSQ